MGGNNSYFFWLKVSSVKLNFNLVDNEKIHVRFPLIS